MIDDVVADSPWHVPVEGCVNFRDAGGWLTADGRNMRGGALYRSDDPVRLTPAGRAAVARLGLAYVIDLRQTAQFARGPGFLPTDRTAWMVAEPLPGDTNTGSVSEYLFSGPVEAMQLVLDRALAEHGLLARWVESFPIQPDTMARLRDGLVD